MKVIEHIEKAKSTLASFEILPPLKGKSIQHIWDTLDPLMEFKPPFIDVTYHREEYIYKKKGEDMFEKVAIRKRPGTVGICSAIMNKYGIDAVPHLICGGFTKEETENALIDLNFLGLENVLIIRGDSAKPESRFIPEKGGHDYAIDLVKQAVKMGKGKYLNEDLVDGVKADFCIGVAGYPEKHFESPNKKQDFKFLKDKIDAGAEYIVTQMFFDTKDYIDFVNECRAIGIKVPIIPGIKPLTRRSQLSVLPSIFHVDIPEDLSEAVEKCKDDEAVRQVGIEWAIQQSKELAKFGVPNLHYYIMSDYKTVKSIVSEVI